MRGNDPETGEFLGPSRSEQRRDALDIRGLGEKLVALAPAHLAKLPIPEDLLEHIHETQRITSHIAHKRQLQFLAKQMRRESDETLDAIRDAMEVGGDAARRETAILHTVEAWRARLLEDGDSALAEVHGDADAAVARGLHRFHRAHAHVDVEPALLAAAHLGLAGAQRLCTVQQALGKPRQRLDTDQAVIG